MPATLRKKPGAIAPVSRAVSVFVTVLVGACSMNERLLQASDAEWRQVRRDKAAQIDMVIPGTTYLEALEVGKRSMEDLEALREAYSDQIEVDEGLAECMHQIARNLSDAQGRKKKIDLTVLKFKSIVIQTISKQLGETARVTSAKAAAELTARARSYSDKAARLKTSLSNIKRAVDDLTKRPARK